MFVILPKEVHVPCLREIEDAPDAGAERCTARGEHAARAGVVSLSRSRGITPPIGLGGIIIVVGVIRPLTVVA